MSHIANADLIAWQHISKARDELEEATKLIECPLCKADVGLILDATIEVEKISDWAAHNNPDSVQAIRRIAREMDKLHMLAFLVTMYKYLSRIKRISIR